MHSTTLMIRNKVKAFADQQGDTIYKLIKKTGISNTTGYALANNPEQIPDAKTLDAICSVYRVQPGELLEWVES